MFLAIVLVLGIIATVSPSFMFGAQAELEDELDNNYKKSYGKDNYKSTEYPSYEKDNSYQSKDSSNVIIKKIKCNNINVNLNGLEINTVPPTTLNGLATEAQAADEGEVGANSFGSDGRGGDGKSSGHDNGFKFVCINNNNNGDEEPVEDACGGCFDDLQADAPRIFTLVQGLIAAGGNIGDFEFPAGTDIDTFCELLSAFVDDNGALPVTVQEIVGAIIAINPDPSLAELQAIIDFIECLIQADLIDLTISAAGLEADVTAALQ